MADYDLRQELKDNISRASYSHIEYIASAEKIINGVVETVNYKDVMDVDYKFQFYLGNMIYTYDLDDLKQSKERIDDECCQAYTQSTNITKNIEGYIDSTIVICKLSPILYKIDSTMEQIDSNTNIHFETNIQYRISINV